MNEQYRAADAQFRSALEGRARPGSALMPVDQWCERDARGYAKAVRDINRYQEQVNSVLRELHAAFGIVGSGLADLDVLRRKGVREPSREFHARFLALQDAKKGLYGIRDPEARGAAAALKAFATAAIALRAEMDRLLARARSADAR